MSVDGIRHWELGQQGVRYLLPHVLELVQIILARGLLSYLRETYGRLIALRQRLVSTSPSCSSGLVARGILLMYEPAIPDLRKQLALPKGEETILLRAFGTHRPSVRRPVSFGYS
jgi:hypothetical protein